MNAGLLIVIVLLLALVAVWWWLRNRPAPAAQSDPTDRLDTIAAWPPSVTRILTTQERLAYGLLARAFPDHLILAQVPLARFLRVPTRYSHSEWLRRVGQMCADLLVCDTASQPLAVIIVYPPGGAKSERARARHERLLRVLRAAEVRTQVWIENALPTLDAVRASVLELPPERSPAIAEAVVAARPHPAAAAPNAFDDTRRDSSHDRGLDQDEPPTTWYDDMNTAPAPLQPGRPGEPVKR